MTGGDREIIDHYLRGDLQGAALRDFELRLQQDNVLRRETQALGLLLPGIHEAGRAMLKNKIRAIAAALPAEMADYSPAKNSKGPLPPARAAGKLWLWLTLSAVVTAAAALAVWWFVFRQHAAHEGEGARENGMETPAPQPAAPPADTAATNCEVQTELLPPADSARVRHLLITYNGKGRTRAQSRKLADSLLCAIQNGAFMESLVLRFTEDPGSLPQPESENEQLRAGNKGDYGWIKKDGPMVKEFSDFALHHKAGDLGLLETQFGYHIMQCLQRAARNQPKAKLPGGSKAFYLPDKKRSAAEDEDPPVDFHNVRYTTNGKILDTVYQADFTKSLLAGTSAVPASETKSPPVIIKDDSPYYRFHYRLTDTLFLYGPFKKELLFWTSRSPGLALHCEGKNYLLKPTQSITPLKKVEMTAAGEKTAKK